MEHFNKSLRPEGMKQIEHTYNFPVHRWPSDYMWMTSLSAYRNLKVVLNKGEESNLVQTCSLYLFKLHAEKG